MKTEVLVALVGVGGTLAGVLIGGGISLLTGWRQRRHEHKRWQLDQLLAAYAAFSAAAAAWQRALSDTDLRFTKSINDQLQRLYDARHRVLLLAPTKTSELADEVVMEVLSVTPSHFEHADDPVPSDRQEKLNHIARELGRLHELQRADIQG